MQLIVAFALFATAGAVSKFADCSTAGKWHASQNEFRLKISDLDTPIKFNKFEFDKDPVPNGGRYKLSYDIDVAQV